MDEDWLPLILPLALLIASLSLGFWLRRCLLRLWKGWAGGKPWGEKHNDDIKEALDCPLDDDTRFSPLLSSSLAERITGIVSSP